MVDRYTLKGALRDAGVDLKEFAEACLSAIGSAQPDLKTDKGSSLPRFGWRFRCYSGQIGKSYLL
jgi:hypothetical protein